MATITPVTRPSKRKDGKRPLYLRIYHKAQVRYISLGIHLHKTHWDERRRRAKSSHPNHREINSHLLRVEELAEEALLEVIGEGRASAQKIKERAEAKLFPEEKGKEACFIEYSRSLLENWRGRWARSTMLSYKTSLSHLESYAGAPLPFEEVTPQFCHGLLDYLLNTEGQKQNTAYKTISALKRFYNDALEDGTAEWGRNPFSAVKITTEVTRREKLSIEELKRLRDLPLEEDSALAEARRLFFFSFYAGGMRFSDVVSLERENLIKEGEKIRVRYRMTKTGKEHEVLLPRKAAEILAYYDWERKEKGERVFPALDGFSKAKFERLGHAPSGCNTHINGLIGELAELAGIEKKVTFHDARHACAGRLLEKGYNTRTIQKVLGHSSVVVTERYLRGFESDGPDEAAEALGGI